MTDFIHFVNDDTLLSVIQSFQEAVEKYMNKKHNKRTKVSSVATKDDGKVNVDEILADYIYYSEDHKLDGCNAFMN